jgi:hypothetical protein
MARFGGSEFTGFSVPLVYEGRYFILEPGNEALVTVFVERNGEPVFEVLKNKPVENVITDVTATSAGVVTVSEKGTGRFLYKVRPGSETSVAFGKLAGGEVPVRITDRIIQVGTNTVQNCTFVGPMAGVVVFPDGGFAMGARIPPIVLRWLAAT